MSRVPGLGMAGIEAAKKLKGLAALLVRDICLDFRTGENIDIQKYFDEAT